MSINSLNDDFSNDIDDFVNENDIDVSQGGTQDSSRIDDLLNDFEEKSPPMEDNDKYLNAYTIYSD